MASAQVYRFQQRVSNLQSHHKVASIRHCEAVNNYINQNNELMNSLMIHLKSTNKNVKRSKRITKPRNTNTQLTKSARFSNKSYAIQSHVEQGNTIHPPPPHHHQHHYSTLTRQTDLINSCLSKELWNDFNETKINNENVVCNSKEPIFPPPTYAESNIVLNNITWENWFNDNTNRNESFISQNNKYSSTIMPKSNYNLYNNTYSYNISPFIYNETIQEKDYWNHDNLLDDIQQETISCIPDYPVSSVQSSFNSYWLKQQSTSYNKHNINNINDNYIYNEKLYYNQNNVKSYPTNQIMNNYSKDIDSMNCDYYKQYDEQSKYPINPILASTYRSVGSSNPYSYQSSVVVDSYKSSQCSKSYYDDCPSYYLSTNSDHTNNNNNNSSSYHCQTDTNTSTKHPIM